MLFRPKRLVTFCTINLAYLEEDIIHHVEIARVSKIEIKCTPELCVEGGWYVLPNAVYLQLLGVFEQIFWEPV